MRVSLSSKPRTNQSLIGIPEIDAHIDLTARGIVAVCSDNSMLSTGLLHFIADESVLKKEFVCYISVNGHFSAQTYPLKYAPAITVAFTNTLRKIGYVFRELPKGSLIIVDDLGSIISKNNNEKYIERFCDLCSEYKFDKEFTILFSEHVNGVTERPQTDIYGQIDYRIKFESSQTTARNHQRRFQVMRSDRILAERNWKFFVSDHGTNIDNDYFFRYPGLTII